MSTSRDDDIELALCGLESAWRGARITVWEVEGPEVRFLRGSRVALDDLSRGFDVWRLARAELRAGRPAELPGTLCHPLRREDGTLLGFVLVLDGGTPATARPSLDAYVEWNLRVLAQALSQHVSVAPEAADAAAIERALGAQAPAPERALVVPASASPDDMERRRLLATLELCGWNESLVARRLRITRTTVWRRMKRLGIVRPLRSPFDSRPRVARER